MNLALCPYCAKIKRLHSDGTIWVHMIPRPISRRNPSMGTIRRRCPGSGKRPRVTTT